MISISQSVWSKKQIKGGDRIAHALQGRIANVETELSNDTFPMQADYLTAFRSHESKFKVLSTLARAPQRNAAEIEGVEKPSTIETLYFRVLKTIYQIDSQSFLSIGRDKKNLGTVDVDHTYFNKSLNGFNVTDLQNGISFNAISSKYGFEVTAFAPSFQEIKGNEEYGGVFQARLNFQKIQIGTGMFFGQTSSNRRGMGNLFLKLGGNRYYFLLDGILTKRIPKQGKEFNQLTGLGKFSLYPFYGKDVEFYIAGEIARREEPFFVSEERLGLGSRLKLTSHFSFRLDYKRTFLSQNIENLFITQIYLNWWSS